MEAIFHPPVVANRLLPPASVARSTGEVEARVLGTNPIAPAPRHDLDHRPEAGSFTLRIEMEKPVPRAQGVTDPFLQAPVILVYRLPLIAGHLLAIGGLSMGEKDLYPPVQGALILLERQEVVPPWATIWAAISSAS